jgi:hypothetical protein
MYDNRPVNWPVILLHLNGFSMDKFDKLADKLTFFLLYAEIITMNNF